MLISFLKKGILTPLTLFTFIISNAQTVDSTKLYSLEEIVVTSTRNQKLLESTPEVMHVITSKTIKELNVSSTGEILEYLTGVNIESGTGSGYPKRSIVSLDGFPANYSLVMVNGVRLLTEHIHTGQNIDVIPPENIERIEVIKGASSAQYGSDAMGGIINIITKKSSEKTESTLALSAGNYNTSNTSFSICTPINEKVSISTFSNYEQSDGAPILSPSHRIDNMGFTKFSSMNNIAWKISNRSSLNTNIFFVQNSMEFRDDNVYGKLAMGSVDYENKISGDIIGKIRLKYSHWDAEQSREKNEVLNPEIFFNYSKFNNHIITIGGDYRHINFARSAVLEQSQQTAGAFAQDEIELKKLSLLIALRFDQVEDLDAVISPKFAIMYQAFDKMRIRASVGRGFHAPTVQELYEEGYGHSGRAYRFGNPELQPEYSLTKTISFDYIPVNKLQIFIYGYHNTINNMITPVYSGIWAENPDTSTVIDKWVRTNIHEAEIFGIETAIKYHINKNIRLEAGYNYTENKNSSTGGQLPYYPGESLFSKLIYNYTIYTKITGSCYASIRATKNRSAWNWKPESTANFDDPDGMITELKDYQMVNAGIRFTYNKMSDIYFNVSNILGQDIEKLDDSYTIIDGEPVYKVGCVIRL